MNKRVLFFSLLIISILVICQYCSNKPEPVKIPEQKSVPLSISQNSGSFNESFSKLLQSYYSLKNAFIIPDISKANAAAVQLMQNADSVNISELKGDSTGMISETAKYFAGTISRSAKNIAGASNTDDKLREFNMITDALWALTRTVKYDGQKVYYQFCPLAFDNTGGYWLSDKIDTGNPYTAQTGKDCSQVNDSLDYSRK
ncbi:MAG TPA: DUF3347 domain-containing protein [Flavitalea sp.]|nr:DUF3347 domain-containing protein [Flavitalea sp.]